MKHIFLAIFASLILSAPSLAQHGTAEPGYFPFGYNGDTWTGQVSAVDDSTREITLSYTDSKHHKTETFVAELPPGYKSHPKDQEPHDLKPSEIPIGTLVKIYYSVKTRKVGGVKTKYNEIVRIGTATGEKK
jgi:hypothetical protein